MLGAPDVRVGLYALSVVNGAHSLALLTRVVQLAIW